MDQVVRRVLGLISAAALVVAPAVVRAAPGDVKVSFESPCKYPSGLAADPDGQRLYVADWREATIYEIERAGGEVIRSFAAPTLKPHGLAAVGGSLWVSDDHTGHVYALNLDTGVVDNTIKAPEKKATGLAYAEGTLFILAEGKVYKVLPEDGTILGYFAAPDKSCSCLAHTGSTCG